jgi:biopolymer transport protein ExbB
LKKSVLWTLFVLIPLGLAPASAALAQEAEPGAAPVPELEASAPAAEGDEEVEARTLREWFDFGGRVMYLIVFCSILSFALVLERAWSLRRSAVIPRRFLREIAEHWHKREIPAVLELCHKSETSLSRVLRAGLLQFDQGLARMEDAIAAQGAHESTVLRRNLPVLGALANIATMLGLLGTVLGMIESFDLIARTGTGDARVVAGGVFQALVTTAAGLMVGIFAIAFHSFFRRKVEGLVIELEDTSIRMLEDLSGEPEFAAQASPRGGDLAPAGV